MIASYINKITVSTILRYDNIRTAILAGDSVTVGSGGAIIAMSDPNQVS